MEVEETVICVSHQDLSDKMGDREICVGRFRLPIAARDFHILKTMELFICNEFWKIQ